jgi:methionyl-tRNA formyltransferase
MRTFLICHDESILAKEGTTRWLASFSDLAGVLILREKRQRLWKRVQREWKRVGLRIFDVAAFRLFYKVFHAKQDHQLQQQLLAGLCDRYAPYPAATPILYTHSPNSAEAVAFLQQTRPDVVIASCKQILKPKAFAVARTGTFALHPGICPEYRNAHGCFWALANGDLERVGMTLLKIDAGIDTGPVYGYFTYDYDEVHESHLVIQRRMMLENLDAIAAKLQSIHDGTAVAIDTTGRQSGEWGQPWMTAYLRWKRAARRRQRSQVATTCRTRIDRRSEPQREPVNAAGVS